MALFPLGILSAAAGGAPFSSDYELIQTQILGSSQASVVFSSLGDYSSTYKHLQIRMTVRTTRTDSNSDFILFRFNGDTSTNYQAHRLYGNGSSVISEAVSGQNGIFLQRYVTADVANVFGGSVLDILDPYSTTKRKTIREFSGFVATNKEINLNSGFFIDAGASITSITLIGGSVAFAAGCRFSLYGLKG
jgi:hypothetical protein